MVDGLCILLMHYELASFFFYLTSLFGNNRVGWQSSADLGQFAQSIFDFAHSFIVNVAVSGHLKTFEFTDVFATSNQDQALVDMRVLAHMRQGKCLVIKYILKPARTAELLHRVRSKAS